MSNDVVSVLNTLIETSKDGQYGFEESAKRVQSPDLQRIFRNRAEDCREAAKELQEMVLKYGGTPAADGTALGAMHRGWVSMKGTVASDSDREVLEEVERGEDKAVSDYHDALTQELPQEVRELIEDQLDGARTHHAEVKRLRDSGRF